MGINNMFVVLAAPAGQLIVNLLIKQFNFTLKQAMFVYPLSFLLTLVFSAFLIKETRCKAVYDTSGTVPI